MAYLFSAIRPSAEPQYNKLFIGDLTYMGTFCSHRKGPVIAANHTMIFDSRDGSLANADS